MSDVEINKIAEDIEREGFVIWNIFHADTAEEEKPEFSYTTGLFRTISHPEIIIFGIDKIRTSVIHRLGTEVVNGSKFNPGSLYPDILGGVNCAFRSVAPEYHKLYFGHALKYYEYQHFSALQCVWPDKSGRFPWEPSFDDKFRWEQELLFDPFGTA